MGPAVSKGDEGRRTLQLSSEATGKHSIKMPQKHENWNVRTGRKVLGCSIGIGSLGSLVLVVSFVGGCSLLKGGSSCGCQRHPCGLPGASQACLRRRRLRRLTGLEGNCRTLRR